MSDGIMVPGEVLTVLTALSLAGVIGIAAGLVAGLRYVLRVLDEYGRGKRPVRDALRRG